MSNNTDNKTIWQKQEELRQWHEREYKQAYPNSVFYTGRSLVEGRPVEGRTWEGLTPERQEHKERIAYMLNCMMMSIGVNISGNFSDKEITPTAEESNERTC